MAVVKAMDSVSVIDYTDVENVKTWYTTVSRTSSAPIVSPTATEARMIADGWGTTEPGIDIAKKLYTVQQCLFGDGTYVWGDVSLSSAYEAAIIAYNSATQAAETAGDAMGAAGTAQEQASAATEAAGSANTNLDEIKRLVDFDKWVNEHCTCVLTTDTEVVPGKFYFTIDDGKYVSITPDEDADPSSLSLYELGDVNASISDFVDTHLVVEDNGDLSVQTDGIKTKLKLSGNGLQLINENGDTISTFSDAITLGDINGMHLTLSPGDSEGDPVILPELGFWQGTIEVAYINAETLYISQARIEESLHIGKFTWKIQSENRISLVYTPE